MGVPKLGRGSWSQAMSSAKQRRQAGQAGRGQAGGQAGSGDAAPPPLNYDDEPPILHARATILLAGAASACMLAFFLNTVPRHYHPGTYLTGRARPLRPEGGLHTTRADLGPRYSATRATGE